MKVTCGETWCSCGSCDPGPNVTYFKCRCDCEPCFLYWHCQECLAWTDSIHDFIWEEDDDAVSIGSGRE